MPKEHHRFLDVDAGRIPNKKVDRVCSHCEAAPYRFVPGEGNPRAKIFILGEAPGETEARQGRPFVGNAGAVLDSLLESSGLSRDQVWISNATRCYMGDIKKKPSREMVDQCSYYWKKEVEIVRPRVILALGNFALMATTGKQGITSKRGEVFWYEQEDFRCKLIPSFHPQYLVYTGGAALPVVIKDFLTAKEETEREEIRKVRVAPYEVIEDCTQAVEYIEGCLLRSRGFSFDFEATGLVYWRDQPVCVAFSCDGKHAKILPILDTEGQRVWTKSEWKRLCQAMQRLAWEHEGRRIALNCKYDAHMWFFHFRVEKYKWRFDDVGVMQHIIEPSVPHNLEVLSDLYTEFGGYKAESAKWMNMALKCPRDILYRRNATDAVATFQLFKHEAPILRQKGLWDLYKSEVETMRNLFSSETKGILVDVDKFVEVDRILKSELEEIITEIRKVSGKPEINPGSNDQVAQLLFQDLKLKPSKKTGGGKNSTDAEVLKELEGKHPIIAQMLRFRQISKLWSTFVKGMRKFIAPDGRVHCDFRVEGSLSGRVTGRSPNMLQIPNEGKAASIRGLFVAPKGWKYISADVSQAELRVIAQLSGDKVMLRAFAGGKDIHIETGSAMFQVPLEQVTKEQRSVGKTTNFAIVYGSQGASLERLGFTRDQILTYMQRYFRKYRGIHRYIQQVPKEAAAQGYLQTVFGRTRYFRAMNGRELSREQERMAINFPTQSTAAEAVRYALNRICQELRRGKSKAFLVNYVYDNLIFEAPDDEVEEVVALVKRELERPIPELQGLILPSEVGIGQSWSATEEKES